MVYEEKKFIWFVLNAEGLNSIVSALPGASLAISQHDKTTTWWELTREKEIPWQKESQF